MSNFDGLVRDLEAIQREKGWTNAEAARRFGIPRTTWVTARKDPSSVGLRFAAAIARREGFRTLGRRYLREAVRT